MLKYVFTFFTINFVLVIFTFSADLSKDVVETLQQDHERMKNFKENYRRMSCKLLVNAKFRAMYETEEIDKYTNRTTPEERPRYIDLVHNEMLNTCYKVYREDKILFEKELFYSYPQDDSQYKAFYKVDLEALLENFPKFNQTEWDIINKKEKPLPKTKKNRYDKISKYENQDSGENNKEEMNKDGFEVSENLNSAESKKDDL